MKTRLNPVCVGCLAVVGLLMPASFATAAITIDGDFSDWAALPIINVDVQDGVTGCDFATVKATSDANFVYFYYSLYAPVNPQAGAGTFLGIDVDHNPATGFDIYGFGAVGSEAAWQNDYPFEQATGVWNTGAGLIGATYAAAPYAAEAIEVEISLPRTATFGSTNLPIFTGDGQVIGFAFYTTDNGSDFISGHTTLVPEPISLATLALGGVALLRRRLND
jgi:hypothetical protein